MFLWLSNWLWKPERDLSLDRDCCRADVWRLGQERVDGARGGWSGPRNLAVDFQ